MRKQFKRPKLLKGHMEQLKRHPKQEEEPQEEEAKRKLVIDEEGNILGYATGHSELQRPSQDQAKGGFAEDKSEAERTLSSKEKTLKNDTDISEDFERLKRQLEERVGLNKSFDVIFREMVFGGQKTGIFYFNGFAKDTVLTDILMRLSYADEAHRGKMREYGGYGGGRGEENAEQADGRNGDKLNVIELFDSALIPHIQVKRTSNIKEAIDNVAMGGTAFFFEGEREAVIVDAKSLPIRSIEEPDLERVVRGSRDGFVETLLTNVSLVRRRLRDPRLKLEILQVGKRTQTDVCIGYIQDICDMDLVESVRDKIKSVNVDGLPLAEKQLEEAIIGSKWNPYPMVRYTERPDVVASHLLEGHLVIFVDTSPSVIILPTTFFHLVQHAEEYRQTPLVGSYLRWVRFLGIVSSVFLLPLWFLIVTSPELKPVGLEFLGPQKASKLPLLLQFLIADLGVDLMRMAAVHTPTPLATAMGLVAAILIGDVAVKAGMFVNEVILYLAVAAIGTFATPSYELGLANRIARLGLLLAAAVFKVNGLVVGSTALLIYLSLQRSYNTPYMWPFIPFNAKAMYDILVRRPFLSMKTRMSLTKTLDSTRQPKSKA